MADVGRFALAEVGMCPAGSGESPDTRAHSRRRPLLTDDEYRAVFEASPDGCLLVDEDGTITGANPRVETLFGWAPSEVVGQNVDVLVPEMVRPNHASHRARFAEQPHARPMGVGLDLRARRKDGSTFPVEISLSPWFREGLGTRVICTVRDVSDYRRLRNFSEGALRASEDERQRIARELHDDTGQRLATLVLRVRRLADEQDPEVRGSLLSEVRSEIIDTADGVRRMARGLRPPELEEVGLGLALKAHVRGIHEATDFSIDLDLEAVDDCLDVTSMLALYRIVQEALSNAQRHSGSGSARVGLHVVEGDVVAVIEDRGVGFSPQHSSSGEGGLGLIGMEERATMIGGRLSIDATPGEGTVVRVSVPCRVTDAPGTPE